MNLNRKSILTLVFLLAGFIKTFGQQSISNTEINVMPTKYAIVFYANEAIKHTGQNSLMAAHWVNKGGGTFTWEKAMPESGNYEVRICYGEKKPGTTLMISVGKDSLIANLAVTSGYYPAGSTEWSTVNFERKQLQGSLHLNEGTNEITVKLTGNNETDLYSIELLPISKKSLAAADLAKAQKAKPDAKWFANSGYGVMFHWTSQSAPKSGPVKPYAEAVNGFDVGKFVKMVQKTGATYVIFTTNHAEPYFPAPLKNWEHEYPGHTTSRDLILEIADSLGQHNIKLILYMATHVYAKFNKVDDNEFERLNRTLLSEIGERYKNKVAGYWLDGWYQCAAIHPSFDFEKFYKTCKIGNKDRLLCLNSWAYPTVSPWQDYWSGEDYTIGNPASDQILTHGPGTGLQAQSLIVMEKDDWLHTAVNKPTKSPDLNPDELAKFIQEQQGKGPVTINIQIYQDGTISDEALNVMESVKKHVAEK